MKRTVVVYKSKYGSTEKYAKWIAEDGDADLFKANEVKVDQLMSYETIIYCGGLYAGGLLGFSVIKKHYKLLRDKNIIVVGVGATLKKEAAIPEVKKHNLPEEMRNNVTFFLLRGGLNYKKMSPLDRVLMYLMVKSIKRKHHEALDDDSKGMIATYGKVVDFTNRKAIEPILKAAKLPRQ